MRCSSDTSVGHAASFMAAADGCTNLPVDKATHGTAANEEPTDVEHQDIIDRIFLPLDSGFPLCFARNDDSSEALWIYRNRNASLSFDMLCINNRPVMKSHL